MCNRPWQLTIKLNGILNLWILGSTYMYCSLMQHWICCLYSFTSHLRRLAFARACLTFILNLSVWTLKFMKDGIRLIEITTLKLLFCTVSANIDFSPTTMNGDTLNEIPCCKRQLGSLQISSRTRLYDTLQKMRGKLTTHSIASFNDLFCNATVCR